MVDFVLKYIQYEKYTNVIPRGVMKGNKTICKERTTKMYNYLNTLIHSSICPNTNKIPKITIGHQAELSNSP